MGDIKRTTTQSTTREPISVPVSGGYRNFWKGWRKKNRFLSTPCLKISTTYNSTERTHRSITRIKVLITMVVYLFQSSEKQRPDVLISETWAPVLGYWWYPHSPTILNEYQIPDSIISYPLLTYMRPQERAPCLERLRPWNLWVQPCIQYGNSENWR